jgi:hypothetical protein
VRGEVGLLSCVVRARWIRRGATYFVPESVTSRTDSAAAYDAELTEGWREVMTNARHPVTVPFDLARPSSSEWVTTAAQDTPTISLRHRPCTVLDGAPHDE